MVSPVKEISRLTRSRPASRIVLHGDASPPGPATARTKWNRFSRWGEPLGASRAETLTDCPFAKDVNQNLKRSRTLHTNGWRYTLSSSHHLSQYRFAAKRRFAIAIDLRCIFSIAHNIHLPSIRYVPQWDFRLYFFFLPFLLFFVYSSLCS